MKKKFSFAFSPLIYVLTSIIHLLLLVVIILDVLRLANVGNLRSLNKALDISGIVISVAILIVVEIFVFGSSYTLKDEYLLYSLGFFRFKISYSTMFLIREEKTTHAMVLNYQRVVKDKDGNENSGIAGLVINLRPKNKPLFVDAIRDKNHAVIYEMIDKNITE